MCGDLELGPGPGQETQRRRPAIKSKANGSNRKRPAAHVQSRSALEPVMVRRRRREKSAPDPGDVAAQSPLTEEQVVSAQPHLPQEEVVSVQPPQPERDVVPRPGDSTPSKENEVALLFAGGVRCRCYGNCYRCDYHIWTSRPQAGEEGVEPFLPQKRRCRYAPSPGKAYCVGCVCVRIGCDQVRQEHSTLCQKCLLQQPLPDDAMEATRQFRHHLVHLDPVDVGACLAAMEPINDWLLLAILALVWDPEHVQALSREFVRLEAKKKGFTPKDLAKAFHHVCDLHNLEGQHLDYLDVDIQLNHVEMLTVGGACRFFGIVCVGKTLQLLSDAQDADGSTLRLNKRGRVEKIERLDTLEHMFEWKDNHRPMASKSCKKASAQGDVVATLQAIEDLIFHEIVPTRLRWGRRPGSYPGQHIVRS